MSYREPYRRDAGYEMNLPDGKTCGDCLHIRRCKGIFGRIEADEVCDWLPVRFMDAATKKDDRHE